MNKVIGAAVFLFSALTVRADISLDFPIVTHTTGVSTTFYTALDATNHTSQPTTVLFEYIANDLSVDATGTLTTLGAYGNFHTDDLLTYLASQSFITNAQANGFGTLLVTFVNAAFTTGSEASATARVYNYLTDGQRPSVGLAYRGAVLRKNGAHTLSSVVTNTTNATGNTPSVITNIGIENVGIDDIGTVQTDVITLKATFYDPKTGNIVGAQPTFTLGPGQMTQVNDIWKSANLPADATSLVMTVTETAGTATIRGYVVVKDTNTNDGAFFFMD